MIPPAAGGRLLLLVTRQGIAIAATAAVALFAGAWYFQTHSDTSSRAPEAAKGNTQAATVTVAQPVKKAFAHEVEALGTVRANESVDITAKIADRVTAIRFKEGQHVSEGDVLV